MHNNLDIAGVGIKKPLGFDKLKALVHHGGTVNTDLPPHAPVRMAYRLLGSYFGQRGDITIPERSTGTGEDQSGNSGLPEIAAPDTVLLLFGQTLKNGIVLAVHRNNAGFVSSGGINKNMPAHNQRFLVRQIDGFPGSNGRQCRLQAGGTDNGRHHAVRIVTGCHCTESLGSGKNLGFKTFAGQKLPELGCSLFLKHYCHIRMKLPDNGKHL